MSDLLSRARNMSAMLRMCEKISFGSDADVIDELAEKLEIMRDALLSAESLFYGKCMRRGRKMIAVKYGEGDGLYVVAGKINEALDGMRYGKERSDPREYLIHKNGYFYRSKEWYLDAITQRDRYSKLWSDAQDEVERLTAENERLNRNAQTEAWLLAGYHRICERHGIAPSSAELIAAAKEAEVHD